MGALPTGQDRLAILGGGSRFEAARAPRRRVFLRPDLRRDWGEKIYRDVRFAE